MPRHLISDAHEWIDEIPAVPIYYSGPTAKRTGGWNNQRFQEDPVELNSSLTL